MKTELTTQESQKLMDLLELDTQMHFRIEDLLKILPPYIYDEGYPCELVITYSHKPKEWYAYYDSIYEIETFCEKELIDALYKLVIWYFNSKFTAK